MKIRNLVLVASLVVIQGGCTDAASDPKTLPIPRTATIKDIMDSHVDPAGDFLFESLQQIADDKGVRQKAPATPAEWAQVRHQFTVLFEAPDYMVMPGRRAAKPTDRVEFPAVESQPEEVQALMDANRDDFVRRARVLQSAAVAGIKAVDARDTTALLAALGGIDKACEGCHLHYYYPKDMRARQAAKEEGVAY
jgi:cytochrome c556